MDNNIITTSAISQPQWSQDLCGITTSTISRPSRYHDLVSHGLSHSVRFHSRSLTLNITASPPPSHRLTTSTVFFFLGFMDFDLGICMIRVLWVAFCHNFFCIFLFIFFVGFVTRTLLVWDVVLIGFDLFIIIFLHFLGNQTKALGFE